MKRLKSKVQTFWKLIKLSCQEKTFNHRLKYLFYGKDSDTLLVVFSAFPPTDQIRLYNYIKSFQNLIVDRLYIKDTFGYKGSYYLYDQGSNVPAFLTSSLISKYVSRGGYKRLIMAGTSKGGIAAIYYGLKYHAAMIFSGACQYHIGTYLSTPAHKQILEGMMGQGSSEGEVQLLDGIMPEAIRNHANSYTVIHLVYSKQEHTYKDDIVDLLSDLDKANIHCVEKEEYFTNHNDVGYYFAPYVVNTLETIL